MFRIGFCKPRPNRIEICDGLCLSDAFLQVSHRHENRWSVACIQVILAVNLFLVHKRHKEIRIEKHQGAMKFRRRDPDDGKRMLVHLNCTAHYASVILKIGVPVFITEHDIRSAIRPMLIGGVEETANIGTNP